MPVLGVEVTELWQHETDARLSKISGYFDSLLDGGDVVHKDDRVVAKVETVQLVPKDSLEPIATVPAIMRKHPSPSERAELFGAALAAKEGRVSNYLDRCQHVDLLVDDRSMIFWFSDFEQLIRPISSDSVRECVTSSRFREIFLVTNEQGGARVRVPLKASLLMEDLLVLEDLLSHEAPELSEQLYLQTGSSAVAVSILAVALAQVSRLPPAPCVEEGRLGVSIGCFTVHWTDQGKVVRDHSCMPEQVEFAPELLLASADIERIARTIAEGRGSYQATVPFALPVAQHSS